MSTVKICKSCKEEKREEDFHRDNYATCIKCRNEQWRYRYKNDHDFRRKYLDDCWRRTLKYKYGITADEYEEILIKQAGLCAICRQPEKKQYKGKITKLHVDHNHETEKIRQLLCHSCNMMIGYAKEDSEVLRKAADYIERHS